MEYQDMPVIKAKGETLGGGTSGIVELLEDGSVVKTPWPGEEEAQCRQDLKLETEVYQRLQANFADHDSFLRQVSFDQDTCTLTMEYMPNGTLRDYLKAHPATITNQQRRAWALSAASGLQMLHSLSIVHGDFTPKNMLLDRDLGLKVADFGCSSVDGAAPSGAGDVRFYPTPEKGAVERWEAQHDVFALGSMIYEICTGNPPYHDVSSRKVIALVKDRSMPDLTDVYMGDVIQICWQESGKGASMIHSMLEGFA